MLQNRGRELLAHVEHWISYLQHPIFSHVLEMSTLRVTLVVLSDVRLLEVLAKHYTTLGRYIQMSYY